MTMFPEQQASYSDEMYKTLDLIEDQQAERAYRIGEHYLWTGKVGVRRVLASARSRQVAQEPLGGEGQGAARPDRQHAAQGDQGEQDHDPAGQLRSLDRQLRDGAGGMSSGSGMMSPNGTGGMGGMGGP